MRLREDMVCIWIRGSVDAAVGLCEEWESVGGVQGDGGGVEVWRLREVVRV